MIPMPTRKPSDDVAPPSNRYVPPLHWRQRTLLAALLLDHLADPGTPGRHSSSGALATLLGVSRATVSRLLVPLEAAGWLRVSMGRPVPTGYAVMSAARRLKESKGRGDPGGGGGGVTLLLPVPLTLTLADVARLYQGDAAGVTSLRRASAASLERLRAALADADAAFVGVLAGVRVSSDVSVERKESAG